MKPPKLIKDLEPRKRKNSNRTDKYALYMCECGNSFESVVSAVKLGRTVSCGCKRASRNNLATHELYGTWKQMKERTSNPKHSYYPNYGGRGITVCDRWLSIENFIKDMYPTFKEGLTIDRIDHDGNYEPSNCRWATRTTQSRNTRKLMSTNTSGYRGVIKHKDKWKAVITMSKKKIYLGLYLTQEEAAKAYDSYIHIHDLEHTQNGVDFYSKLGEHDE